MKRGPARSFAEAELGLTPGLFPFRSKFFDVASARLHYVAVGRGPLLFMLHGNPTWSFLYRKMIAALASRYRCVAMDLPGFGLSRPPVGFGYRPEDHVPLVRALLGQLNARDATLIAHDWGGPIGLAAALGAPGRLTRFVLGNTWAWPVNGDWHFEWFSRLMGGPIARALAPRYNLFVNGLMRGAMRRGPLPAEVLEAYRAPFKRSGDAKGTWVFPGCIVGSRAFLQRLEEEVARIDGRRVLLLWPDKDVAFRRKELARWQTLFPAASVVSIANCGHYLWEEAAEDCLAAVNHWLVSTD
ncbi:MAG: alpha/beta fold hydrolase [Betaproteobacteria bacterium]